MNEKQKEITLQVLEKIKPYRDLAEVFLLMIKSWRFGDNLLEDLSTKLAEAINAVRWTQEESSFANAKQIIDDIKAREQHEIDEQEAEKLLDLM